MSLPTSKGVGSGRVGAQCSNVENCMAQRALHTQLYRSRNARVGGVCAGIAERFDLDTIVVRILAVLLTLSTAGLAACAYLVLWVYLPVAPDSGAPLDVVPESAESDARGPGADSNAFAGLDDERDGAGRLSITTRLAIAVGLMLLFMVVALSGEPLVKGSRWWQFWPLALLMVGLCLIVIPVRTRHETLWHAAGIVLTSLSAAMAPMSLGILSWSTFPYALQQMPYLVLLALVFTAFGLYHKSDALIVMGALCVAAFCLAAMFVYPIGSNLEAFLISVPGGYSVRFFSLALS